MAEIKPIGDKALRLTCDCGEFVHTLTQSDQGIDCETIQVKKKETQPPAPPAPKRSKSIFDRD